MISKLLTIFLYLEVRANSYFSHGQHHLPQIQQRSQLVPIQRNPTQMGMPIMGTMGMVSPVLSFKPVFLLTDKFSSSRFPKSLLVCSLYLAWAASYWYKFIV